MPIGEEKDRKHPSEGLVFVFFLANLIYVQWIDELKEQVKSTWKVKSDFAFLSDENLNLTITYDVNSWQNSFTNSP